MRKLTSNLFAGLLAAPLLFSALLISGCDDDRDVLDVETPEGELDVDQDRDTGELEVDAD